MTLKMLIVIVIKPSLLENRATFTAKCGVLAQTLAFIRFSSRFRMITFSVPSIDLRVSVIDTIRFTITRSKHLVVLNPSVMVASGGVKTVIRKAVIALVKNDLTVVAVSVAFVWFPCVTRQLLTVAMVDESLFGTPTRTVAAELLHRVLQQTLVSTTSESMGLSRKATGSSTVTAVAVLTFGSMLTSAFRTMLTR